MEEGQGSRSSARSDEPKARSEVRWSVRRKEGVVMRLLRGESLDLLARETGQPAGRIASWRQEQKRVRGLREGVESVGIVEKQRPGEGRGRALLFARRESRHPNRSRYSIPSKRRGRCNAPRAITREVSHTALALRPVGGESDGSQLTALRSLNKRPRGVWL